MRRGGRINLGRGRGLCVLIAVALLAAAALGPVASATADTFTVDSIGDGVKSAPGAVCETGAGPCTLRAAIEAADQREGLDTIFFDETLFADGADATIEPLTPLPAITDPVRIDDRCPDPADPDWIPIRPCAGVDAEGLATGFLVESDEVAIEGVAVTGAAIGIDVADSADEFAARRDTLGAKLGGASAPNGIGIRLGPGADEAGIGTPPPYGNSSGNTFVGNTEVGLDLEGASHTVVRENEFASSPAPNGTDIEITDVSTGGRIVKAVDNEIGAKKSRFAERSTGCSESCNVISGAVHSGIDLQGDGGDELPASGPTVIRGNLIGATWSGEAADPDGETGVAVGSADEVTIGGPLAASEGNQFVGGLWAVTAGQEETDLTIEGNSVGRSTNQYPHLLDPPSEGAVSLDTWNRAGVDTLPAVVGNELFMSGGVGVLDSGMGARIAENLIGGTDTAIRVDGERMWWGARVEDNEIEYPGEYGIVLENWGNLVIGNFVFGATKAGILVESPGWTGGTEDIIGGQTDESVGEESHEEWWWLRWEEAAREHEEEENEIDYSGGPAIEIVGQHTAFVDALRNFGKQNGGPFVDLGGDGAGNQPDGPNKGIQAPTILSATQDRVSGAGALSGGTRVMVFLKATSSPGEIAEYLGSTFAEEDGRWSMALPEGVPVGAPIAVSQVNDERGSSEMAFGTVAAGTEPAPTSKGEAGSASEEESAPQVSEPDKSVHTPRAHSPVAPVTSPASAPEVHMLTGPPRSSTHARARFKFAASTGGAKFECKLDNAKWASCKSPKTYKKLKPGKYTFQVRAEAGGLTGTAAKFKFTVVRGQTNVPV